MPYSARLTHSLPFHCYTLAVDLQHEAAFTEADFDVFFQAVSLAVEHADDLSEADAEAFRDLLSALQSTETTWEMTETEFLYLLSAVGVLHEALRNSLGDVQGADLGELNDVLGQVEQTHAKLLRLKPGLLN